MRKKSFVAILLLLLCISVKSQTIHAFVFANTDDPHIGRGNEQNVSLISGFLDTLKKESKMNMNLQTFTVKEEVSKENVGRMLDTLSCSWQDVIIFYYAGHGCRAVDDKSVFPQLCFNSTAEQDFISSEDIWSQLSSKGAHLCIVLCDASNVITSWVSPKESVISNKEIPKKPLEIPSGISDLGLMLYAEANIIAASSSIGGVAWIDRDGSFFTKALIDSYKKNKVQTPNALYSWDILLKNILQSEIFKSAAIEQKPIFKIVGM